MTPTHQPSEESLMKVAQLWCLPQHSNKTMDTEFAKSIAELLDQAKKPLEIEVFHLQEELTTYKETLKDNDKIHSQQLSEREKRIEELTKKLLEMTAKEVYSEIKIGFAKEHRISILESAVRGAKEIIAQVVHNGVTSGKLKDLVSETLTKLNEVLK